MTVATEAEKNPTVTEKEDKDVKDIKAALNEETPSDNKQQSAEDGKVTEKTEGETKKEETTTANEENTNKVNVHKANFEKDVVYLYQFSRTPLIPSISPYCLKVETWLRLNGVKYENVDHKMKFRSKKGQLPFVEVDGAEIADSALILKELSQKFSKELDNHLTNEQKTISHAMISMIENHLWWVVHHWRSKNVDQLIKGYKVNLQHALGSRLPNGLLNFIFKFTYGRKGAKKVKAHGLGVHSAEEIFQFGCDDLKALSELLTDKPFFFGDEPTTLDIIAFANLAQILYIENSTSFPLRDFMTENCSNLVGLCSRMKERCFPDWEKICDTLDMNTHLPKPQKEEEKESKGEKEAKESKEGKEGDKEKADAEEKEGEKDKEVEENKEKEERVEDK